MRLDWEIARRGYRRYAAYPAATAAGVFTNTIFGFMLAYILLAVFDDEDRRRRLGRDRRRHVRLVRAGDADDGLRVRLVRGRAPRSAAVTSPPTSRARSTRCAYWLAFDYGRAFYHFVFRGIPPFVVGALVFDFRLPTSVTTWLAVLVSLALAVAVSFGWRFLYNAAAFWLLDYRGVGTLAISISLLFSGFVIPLTFFPDWLEQIARALPFAAMVQIPVDIFLGQVTGAELVAALAPAARVGGRADRSRPARARGRHAEAGDPGWLRRSRSTAGSSARRSARSSSTGSRSRSTWSARS